MTVEDLAKYQQDGRQAHPALAIGSDVEIAGRVANELQARDGDIISCEGAFWRFEETCWRPIPDHELRVAVHAYDGSAYITANGQPGRVSLNKTRVSSIINEMSAMLAAPGFFDQAAVGINCASGFVRFLDDGTPQLEAHSPEHRCRNVLPGHWSPDIPDSAYHDSLLVKLIRGCFAGYDSAGKKDILEEIAGATALGWSTRLLKPKAVVLWGKKAENGKSQILDMLRGLLPRSAMCSIPPHRLGDERYVPHLAGKLLNANDEVKSAESIASEAFKSAITGEPMSGRDVYKSSVEIRPQALHVFAVNELPMFKGGMDRGVMRRLLVVRFDRTIPGEERVPHIGQRIADEEPHLLLDFAIRGAQRLIRRGCYNEPQSSVEALHKWIAGADPVQAWLGTIKVTGKRNDRVRTRDAYKAFRDWALDEGYKDQQLPASNRFAERVEAHADVDVAHPKRVSTLRGLRLEARDNDDQPEDDQPELGEGLGEG